MDRKAVDHSFKHFIGDDSNARDALASEILEVKENLLHLSGTEFDKLPLHEKWITLFKSENIVRLKQLVFALLSVFPSNAYCESIFSVVKSLWTDEKNRMNLELLNALVSVKKNTDYKCTDFYQSISTNTTLLKKAKEVEKYHFGK